MLTPTNENARIIIAQPDPLPEDESLSHERESEIYELHIKYDAACQRINELEEQIQCLIEERLELRNKISSLETQELSSVHQELMW